MNRLVRWCLAAFLFLQGGILLAQNARSSPLAGSDFATLRADLDGDGRPDLITGQPTLEFGYVVKIQWAAMTPPMVLKVAFGGSGTRVVARDVNLDGHADIVLEANASLWPVAVWLGDGRGHFQPGDPWIMPISLGNPACVRPPQSADQMAGVFQPRRVWADGLTTTPATTDKVPDQWIILLLRNQVSLEVDRNSFSRSPPLSL